MAYKITRRCFIYLATVTCLSVQLLIATACPAAKVNNANVTSEAQNAAKMDEQVSLLDGRISFVPPAGFKTSTKAQLNRKLPDNSNPLLILANADQTADITVNYDDDLALRSNQLPEVKKFTEGTFRAAGMQWLKSEIVEMNGRQWFHFEWESRVSELSNLVAPPEPGSNKTPETKEEKPAHYHEYSTVYDGKILSFAYVAQVKEHPQLKDDFMKSVQTIRLKE